MKIALIAILSILITTMTARTAVAQTADNLDSFFSPQGSTVTSASYPTDETSRQIFKSQDIVGVNVFLHKRQLTPTDEQPVVRMNRDTYYSNVVVDISKGATVTMPEVPEGKYMSVQPVTEDHRIQPMFYGPGTFELSTHTGSHLYLIIRLDATFTEAEAAKYQDQMAVNANSDNLFKAAPVNQESFIAVEDSLKAQMPAIAKRDGKDALTGMFTAPTDESGKLFTQEKYELGAAVGWGGAQEIDNIYEISGNFPADTCHEVTFADPKNKAFWSLTVYNKAGFMFNDHANLSSNNATPNADGTYTISFGCGENTLNNIETANDSGVFNLSMRHYQPSELVSEGLRILPTVKAVK